MYKVLNTFASSIRIASVNRLGLRAMASTVPVSPKENVGSVEKTDSDKLEKIDVEKLPPAQRRFVEEIQRANEERIKEIFRINYRNIAGLVIVLSAVLSIYFYTMYAVKQETILEEIDEEMSQQNASGKEDVKK